MALRKRGGVEDMGGAEAVIILARNRKAAALNLDRLPADLPL